MPYIPQDKRPQIDEKIIPLIQHLQSLPVEQQDGALNYAVTKILKELYAPKYFNYNRAMGVLSSIQAEWYRRDVAPYEDKKIQENGDVWGNMKRAPHFTKAWSLSCYKAFTTASLVLISAVFWHYMG